jgi:hypothetical protein
LRRSLRKLWVAIAGLAAQPALAVAVDLPLDQPPSPAHGQETPVWAPEPTEVVMGTGAQPGPRGWMKS